MNQWLAPRTVQVSGLKSLIHGSRSGLARATFTLTWRVPPGGMVKEKKTPWVAGISRS
jgi:hypothetical protein